MIKHDVFWRPYPASKAVMNNQVGSTGKVGSQQDF